MAPFRLRPLRESSGLVLFAVLLVVAASVLGSAVTMPRIPNWYAAIEKPSFTPPNWVFGPAWTLLFTLMAISFQRILRVEGAGALRMRGIVLFLVQLMLNVLWSVAFFGLKNPPLALAIILVFEALILATMVVFAQLDRPAAWLLAPYPLWVAYATAINLGVVMLN
jgi:benzodiazapine receptor